MQVSVNYIVILIHYFVICIDLYFPTNSSVRNSFERLSLLSALLCSFNYVREIGDDKGINSVAELCSIDGVD